MAKSLILERAFELARSGECANLYEVRVALRREGFLAVDLMDITPALANALGKLCADARA